MRKRTKRKRSLIRYYVTTWDIEKQIFTPQQGVRTGPYSLFGLRKAIRKLREMGYSGSRDDAYVMVDKCRIRKGAIR